MHVYENQSRNDVVGFLTWNKPWLALLILIDLVALFGNLVVICGVVYTKHFRTSSHYLLASLSISDLITSIVVMPLGIMDALTSKWRGGKGLCLFWLIVDFTCCSASVLNLALISLDKYWCILKPLRYPSFEASNLCFIMIGLVWFMAFLTTCLPLLGWSGRLQGQQEDVCVVGWLFPSYYYVFFLIFNLLCPFLVMLYVYASIFLTARRQLHRISVLFLQHNQSAISRSVVKQNKACGRLGVLLGVFLICWSPYLLVTLYLQVRGMGNYTLMFFFFFFFFLLSSILFYSILFYSILFYSILFYSILFYSKYYLLLFCILHPIKSPQT